MTDHAKTTAILRAVADLLEASPDLPAPYLSFHFHLDAGKDYNPSAKAAEIAAAFPGLPWAVRTSESGGKETTWLESRNHHPMSVAIAAPPDSMGTQAGKRVVTAWEPLPVIAAILAGNEGGAWHG